MKEAVGAGLLGCKAPFRLVQDHSRSGRLEASSLALRKWLFSEAFDAYLNLLQVSLSSAAMQPKHHSHWRPMGKRGVSNAMCLALCCMTPCLLCLQGADAMQCAMRL